MIWLLIIVAGALALGGASTMGKVDSKADDTGGDSGFGTDETKGQTPAPTGDVPAAGYNGITDEKKPWVTFGLEITANNESPKGRYDYVFKDGTLPNGDPSVSFGRYQFNQAHSLHNVIKEAVMIDKAGCEAIFGAGPLANLQDLSWLKQNSVWFLKPQLEQFGRSTFGKKAQDVNIIKQYVLPIIDLATSAVTCYLLIDSSVQNGPKRTRELWNPSDLAATALALDEAKKGYGIISQRRRKILVQYGEASDNSSGDDE